MDANEHNDKRPFLTRLRDRWKLKSAGQAAIVLLCFALTGFSVLFLKQPVLWLFGVAREDMVWWQSLLYYVFILPIYQLVLLFWGFVFGQFAFFWEFEKRMFARMGLGSRR